MGYLNTTNTEMKDHTVLGEIVNLEQNMKKTSLAQTWQWLNAAGSGVEQREWGYGDMGVICTAVTAETMYMDPQATN